jgi:hypothetical protein
MAMDSKAENTPVATWIVAGSNPGFLLSTTVRRWFVREARGCPQETTWNIPKQ